MVEAEKRGAKYLSKLRLTGNVKKLISRLFLDKQWEEGGQGYEGVESEIKLSGWNRRRKVVVLRRKIVGDVAITDMRQLELGFIETAEGAYKYEYAVLVTSLREGVRGIAQLYRDRADSENCYDELKNQWGWGGYTTQDIKRCQLVSRMVALVYNWWSLFVRLARPDKHHEAITSRPLMLHGVLSKVS